MQAKAHAKEGSRASSHSRQDQRRGAQVKDSLDDITKQLQMLNEESIGGSKARLTHDSNKRSGTAGSKRRMAAPSDPSVGSESGKHVRGASGKARGDSSSAQGESRGQKVKNKLKDTVSSQQLDRMGYTSEGEDIHELKDAIIELYLAIKIRSTEEVSQVAIAHPDPPP